MFLVDNFKIFLLVGLICAVGVPSADAQAKKCMKGAASEDCKVGADEDTDHGATPQCKLDATGALGCMKKADCDKNTPTMYCCSAPEENCNDITKPDNKKACHAASPEIAACKEGGDDPAPSPTEKPPANSTATGMVPNYYGGIPVVAAVIPIFLVSLKSFS